MSVLTCFQHVRPDVLLINEFDYDKVRKGAALFQDNDLGRSQNGKAPITYRFYYANEVNTGVPSGHDLDGDGKVASKPGDRGYGGATP